MNKNSCILIIDTNDVIGSSLCKKFINHDYGRVLESDDLDYTNKNALKEFIFATKPEYVFISDIDEEFEINVIKYSIQAGAKAIVNYMRIDEDKPYLEEYKDNLITILIDEVYGDNDDYNYETCRIFPEMIRKIHDSNVYNIPTVYIDVKNNRKVNFIHNDDLANASIQIITTYQKGTIVDLRTGSNLNLKSLGGLIKEQLDYYGMVIYVDANDYNYDEIEYTRPVKVLNWMPKMNIRQGVRMTYMNLRDQKDYFFISKIF